MTLQLAREEPEAGPWRVESLSAVTEALIGRGPSRVVSGRPVILAVDGRSNAGKTTLAARIGEAVPGSRVVHTDDIAWEHSRFGNARTLSSAAPRRSPTTRPPRSSWRNHGGESRSLPRPVAVAVSRTGQVGEPMLPVFAAWALAMT